MPFETERLILRELTMDDFQDWYDILSDSETMKHYPAPFDADKVRQWIRWNIDNYATYGFGLWAVILKETGAFIGDCGMTMQNIHGQQLPELGYHISKHYQRKGYAREASARCLRFAFEEKNLPAVYSYMKHTNEASYGMAVKNGMRFIEEYPDPVNTFTKVYAITREEWSSRIPPRAEPAHAHFHLPHIACHSRRQVGKECSQWDEARGCAPRCNRARPC